MVQDISTPETQTNQLPVESGDDFGIIDTTPQSVIDAENAMLNGEAVDDYDEGADTADEDGAEPSEPTAVTESPIAEPTPAPTGPPEGYRPIADFTALQKAKDLENAALRKQVDEKAIEVDVEARRRDLSAWYAEQGIDPLVASQRIQEEVSGLRESLQTKSMIEQYQQSEASNAQAQVGNIMSSWALELKRNYSLSDEDTRIVQSQANIPITDEVTLKTVGKTMGAMAARLGSVAKAEQSAKKLAEVPAGSVQLENGASNAPPADPEAALVRSARSKQGSQWTDAEHEAMRKRAQG